MFIFENHYELLSSGSNLLTQAKVLKKNEPKLRKNMFKTPRFITKFTTTLKTRRAKRNKFKTYIDLDFQFYSLSFDALLSVNYVYDENELYDQSIVGITTFLKLQKPNRKDYEFYPEIYFTKLKSKQEYAVVSYSFSGAHSTKAVALVQSLELDNIEIFKHTKH